MLEYERGGFVVSSIACRIEALTPEDIARGLPPKAKKLYIMTLGVLATFSHYGAGRPLVRDGALVSRLSAFIGAAGALETLLVLLVMQEKRTTTPRGTCH